MDGEIDARWMARANQLSLRGWGRTWPNPLVGAVVVCDNEMVGEGWHAEFGEMHAEPMALAGAGRRADGATLYVTLEPCTHTGKQPPCTDAIINAKIARVVVAVRDPNPVAAGGIERLRGAGIQVSEAPAQCSASARQINFRFLHRYAGSDRPFVAIKLAVTMDGYIADQNGVSRWISGDAARRWVHWLRAGFGAIAVGGATAGRDRSQLSVRGPLQPSKPPVRVLFDRSGCIGADAPVFDGAAPTVVVTDQSHESDLRARLTSTGAMIMAHDTLDGALRALHRHGVDCLLVEGGGRLASAFLDAGLVDRVYAIQSPRWLGAGVHAWTGLRAAALAESDRWVLSAVERLGEGADCDALIQLDRR